MAKITLFNTQTTSISDNFRGILDIDRIYANPVYACSISKINGAAGNQSIEGIYNSDSPFNISITSNYVDQFELPIQPGLDALNPAVNWARNMQGKSQMILKSLRMTEQRWNGSTEPTFRLSIDIPIVRRTDAQWKAIQYALQAVSGTKDEVGGNSQVQRIESAWQIFAPNGYKVVYAKTAEGHDEPQGTHNIVLGKGEAKWFQMINAIITDVDCSIGPKKYYDGNPTSVTISIQFKFWRYPLYEDVISWFPKIQGA